MFLFFQNLSTKQMQIKFVLLGTTKIIGEATVANMELASIIFFQKQDYLVN
jgi:hypothetical protein